LLSNFSHIPKSAGATATSRSFAHPGERKKESFMRLVGADYLRLAALLSIIMFHVSLENAQFAKLSSSPTKPIDVLLIASTIFDNRTLAILSFLLLFLRHSDEPYWLVLVHRAKRLLVPYFAWTSIYPFLGFGLAALKGQSDAYAAALSHVGFWVSGYLLATTTEHLHFLPTLFILTIIYPFYKIPLSLPLAIPLIAAASAIRASLEFLIIGERYTPTARDLVALTGARVLEYLPLGIFAFALSKAARDGYAGVPLRSTVVIIGILIVASILLTTSHLVLYMGQPGGQVAWLCFQAVFGTITMSLTTLLTLAIGRRMFSPPTLREIVHFVSQRSLGIFLLHPFFIDLFDTIVGQPNAYALALIAPKFLFAFACSFLASSALLQTKGLRAIV
jgi:fucose 4-O-acetylase-like acetyltransferase